MKKEPDRRAFTLVELIVVIAIIALAIAFFVPNFARALGWARTFKCANNLKRIGEAVADRRGSTGSFSAASWPAIVLPFVDNQPEMLICPEADTGDILEDYNPLVNMGQMVFGNSNLSPLGEHAWVGKLSGTQHAAERAAGNLSGADEANNWDKPAYVPDENPHIYWLCYEDLHGGDADFKDTMLKVTETGGSSVITIWRGGGTGVSSSLEEFELGIVRSFGTWGGNNDLVEQTDPGGWTFNTGGATTYGMNMNVARLDGGTKILAVDFDMVVVNTDAGAWDANPSFARHNGKMNVLHMNGSVKTKSPDDIDPAMPTVGQRCWRP